MDKNAANYARSTITSSGKSLSDDQIEKIKKIDSGDEKTINDVLTDQKKNIANHANTILDPVKQEEELSRNQSLDDAINLNNIQK
ncbi:hypothetical protein ACX1NY_13700 [Acinetobacter sp. ANC 4631]